MRVKLWLVNHESPVINPNLTGERKNGTHLLSVIIFEFYAKMTIYKMVFTIAVIFWTFKNFKQSTWFFSDQRTCIQHCYFVFILRKLKIFVHSFIQDTEIDKKL